MSGEMTKTAGCRVHNVRFYNLEPRAITCLAYEKRDRKLALSRSDNSIEIWNLANSPFIESTICDSKESSIEALLWIDSRLFSTGLSGLVKEYDPRSLRLKYETMATGGPVWCMDANPSKTRLAVGTEEGYINTFAVTLDELVYERLFDKQKGRILCLKWDNTGEMIFSGSSDTVRVWNARSGHAVHRMTTSRQEKRKQTVVWCLAVTDDNLIVSGDSQGMLSFWDPSMGTLIESHQSHTADILAIAISAELDTIYCAGVDPVVRSFKRISALKAPGKRPQWVKGMERRLHVHDVRALLEAEGKLLSAGVDGYLAVSSYPPKMLVKFPPLLQPRGVVTVCPRSRCVLLRYANYLELWRLGSARRPPDREASSSSSSSTRTKLGYVHELEEEPMNLLRLGSRNDESIVSCAIGRDSKTIVYSTDSHVRVFQFDVVDGDAQLNKNQHDILARKVQRMLFDPKGRFLVTVSTDHPEQPGTSTVGVYRLEKPRLRYLGSFQTEAQGVTNVGLICFSPDSKYLVLADVDGQVVVYRFNDGDVSEESLKPVKLPKYRCAPTAMNVQRGTSNLVVVYADHKILEYNIPRRQYTKFSKTLEDRLPGQWLSRSFPITNVIFDPRNEDIVIMHDDTTIYVLNKGEISEWSDRGSKVLRRDDPNTGGTTTVTDNDSNSGMGPQSQCLLRVVKKYKHLVHLDWLTDTEMVAVEVNPVSLTEKLPPSLKQKWFGV